MKCWPHEHFLDLLGVEIPIIQAPMAGCDTPALAAAVSQAGGLGSLACALLDAAQIKKSVSDIRAVTSNPINLNFFCHSMSERIDERAWRTRLAPYYREYDLDINQVQDSPLRLPFDKNICAVVEELKPAVVSFHFGLPEKELLSRLKDAGIKIFSSATTLEEAKWLEAKGCDAIVAQGVEAGGHRAMFMTEDLQTQIPMMTLLQQMKANISVPIIGAGGIGNAESIAHTLKAGASAVQLGTAYLFCLEAKVSPLYLGALYSASLTEITNIFSGKPARGIANRLINEIGPISEDAPAFPYAARLISPLRATSEKQRKLDCMQMWAGENRYCGEVMSAGEMTLILAEKAYALI